MTISYIQNKFPLSLEDWLYDRPSFYCVGWVTSYTFLKSIKLHKAHCTIELKGFVINRAFSVHEHWNHMQNMLIIPAKVKMYSALISETLS